ncbi:MAG: HEPN domain-containing protein [Chloroflexi bacterium]|nr:HEPN domain-containing protein [Chloroflexota bacterium]
MSKPRRVKELAATYRIPARGVLSHLRAEERAALADYVACLREKFPDEIQKIILFGSKARGDATDESDLDLLIVTRGRDPNFPQHFQQATYAKELEHNVIFGGTTMTAEKFAWNREHRSPIYRSVMSEGINLLAQPPRRISPRATPAIYQGPKRRFKLNEHAKLMIRLKFGDGKEDLETAQELLRLGRYRGAISQGYYAVFMVSTAVLLTLDLVRAKHSGVQSAFHEYFIKEKRFEPEYGTIFDHSRKYREGTDYKSWRFTQEKAEKIVADCEKFFVRTERYLKEIGALED